MRRLALLALAVLPWLGGCAGIRPMDYQAVDERGGPGLFSGKEGKFVIYGK